MKKIVKEGEIEKENAGRAALTAGRKLVVEEPESALRRKLNMKQQIKEESTQLSKDSLVGEPPLRPGKRMSSQ